MIGFQQLFIYMFGIIYLSRDWQKDKECDSHADNSFFQIVIIDNISFFSTILCYRADGSKPQK